VVPEPREFTLSERDKPEWLFVASRLSELMIMQTVVLSTGEVIKTRQRARKSSAGWDSTKLFIGAEGTLGIVTEATLRLAPLLPTKCAVVTFPGVEEAVGAATEV